MLKDAGKFLPDEIGTVISINRQMHFALIKDVHFLIIVIMSEIVAWTLSVVL